MGGLPGILAIIGAAFSKNIAERGMVAFNNLRESFSTFGESLRTGVSASIIAQQRVGAALSQTLGGD